MNFDDTQEEASFRAEANAFLSAHADIKDDAKSKVRDSDPGFIADAKVWQALKADNGFAQITWPKAYGGRGASLNLQVIWDEVEARYDVPTGPFTIGLGMCVPTIIAIGTDAQKERFVEPALRGEEIWAQLFSEPSAGSDVAGVRMKATKDGDDWILNGQKVWTSGAHYSDFGLVLTRTDPAVAKHDGLTMFIVDLKAPGVDVRPIHQASGGSDFNEVYFSDVQIPDANRVGDVGQGWRVAIVTLMNERLAVGGSLGPDWNDLFNYVKQSGDLEDPQVREKLADWYVQYRGYGLTKLRMQTALSRGEAPGPENSIGKLITAVQGQDICHAAIELQDHFGILQDDTKTPMQGMFQDNFIWAAGLRIAGGTDEILRNIIAERVLGLPSDIRVDKGVPFNKMK